MKINSRKVLPFLYLFPAILILGVFVYYPIIENIYNSFFDWSVFKPDRAFVGLEYYKELFRDEIFWICLKNNALYALVSLIGQVFFGLIIAFGIFSYHLFPSVCNVFYCGWFVVVSDL